MIEAESSNDPGNRGANGTEDRNRVVEVVTDLDRNNEDSCWVEPMPPPSFTLELDSLHVIFGLNWRALLTAEGGPPHQEDVS